MVRKLFQKMSLVQMVAAVTYSLCLLIDGFVIGKLLGTDAMSAYGLATPLAIVFAAIGNFLICGTQVASGKCVGRGNTRAINECFSTSIVAAMAFAVVCIALVFGLTEPICMLLGAGGVAGASPDAGAVNPSIFQMTGDYLKGYTLLFGFLFLYNTIVPYLQILGKRRLLLISVIVMTITNAVFDFLSVYVFHAGLFGIGLATGLGYFLAFLVGASAFLKKDCSIKFSPKLFRPSVINDLALGGSSILVNDFAFIIRIYLVNIILLSISGTEGVAAYSIVNTLCNFIFSIAFGCGTVTLTLSAIFFEEEDGPSLGILMKEMQRFPLILMSIVSGFAGIFAPFLIWAFVEKGSIVMALAIIGLRLNLLAQLPATISTAYRNFFQGIGQGRQASFIAIARFLIFSIPCIWAGGKVLGINGVWIGVILGETLTFLWANAKASAYKRDPFAAAGKDGKYGAADRTASGKGGAADLTVSGKDGKGGTADRTASGNDGKSGTADLTASASHAISITYTINQPGDAAAVSENICNFCKENSFDERTSMLIGLCVEEIGNNILEFGFTKGRNSNNADVRLVLKKDKLLLRIRDNCAQFDPIEYLKMHQSDDPFEHIGLRLVTKIASHASYQNSMGLNILTLEFEKITPFA